MNGSVPSGNSSTASSHSLPAHPDEEMFLSAEDLQSSAETQLPEKKSDQLDSSEHSHPQDPPPEKQELKHFPAPKSSSLPAEQQQSGHLDQTSPTQRQTLRLNPLYADQKKPGCVCPLESEPTLDLSRGQQTQNGPTNPGTAEDPPDPPKDLTGFSSSINNESKDQQDQQPSSQSLSSATLLLAPPVTIEAFCNQVPPPTQEPKLCGFLQKQGGPLKAWKQRWFTYEEKKNQLFYYRTPQDVTPLGRVELSCATFTYPLKAENGTFHIQTPERTFILKAVTQEVMIYWLQQLQMKRWQHRQMSTCPGLSADIITDNFLPPVKSPLGLVGLEAANASSLRMPLCNMSIKHPLIELQNSVHSRRKRSSQDWSRIEAPHLIQLSPEESSNNTPQTLSNPLSSADRAGPAFPVEDRKSPSLFESRSRKMKSRSSSSMPVVQGDSAPSSFDRMSRLQQEKQMLMEEVKAQKELVWILHKALEAAQLEKRTCAEFVAVKGEQERLELLRHRERQAANLQRRLEEIEGEAELMRRRLAQKDTQLAELQEKVKMLMEKNDAKQEVIIKLSEQLTFLSDSCRCNSEDDLDMETFIPLHQEIENLKDDLEAYKTQNQFLNSEIQQLTRLWGRSSEQEKSLMVKCAYLEASHCQVESRYLDVLRKLQETKVLDPVQQDAVQRMIEDALKGELKNFSQQSISRDHDEYGFKTVPDYEVDDMKLLSKIQALEIRSHNLLYQDGVEHPLLSRWAQFLAGRSEDDLCPSPELKGLLRGGVPREYRQRMWTWMVRARTKTIRDRQPALYQQLREKSRTCPHPASRQIQLDLHRTLTTNQQFSSPSSPALHQLRRILLAFSWQNPAIGYCQGLNRLAAIALLILQSEEDAFWCLVAVVETIMPQDYYTKNLVASQADQRVLKDFLAEKLPRLASHFEDHSIDVSLITFNWFLVVFVESLPSDILLPLWDAFLYEGTKVIFRYALALFKYQEENILKIHDRVEIYQYLRFFTKTICDGRRLATIAFNDMNPFPGRLLRSRRMLHLEHLQAELQELEEQQKEFVTESIERKDKELDAIVSEEDDELIVDGHSANLTLAV
ncbi:TBC1 domain family member 2A isoform X2 [Echeneis naucrates]|uniref:TBC1 domain family, member 2 n=1 Tax=Echeneis naucrates TaxID=173247 RepID=A0A665TZQ1_ECHNA|nr:TBC1 domain family member 2A isoform X2 [Echeneis naucrates]